MRATWFHVIRIMVLSAAELALCGAFSSWSLVTDVYIGRCGSDFVEITPYVF